MGKRILGFILLMPFIMIYLFTAGTGILVGVEWFTPWTFGASTAAVFAASVTFLIGLVITAIGSMCVWAVVDGS